MASHRPKSIHWRVAIARIFLSYAREDVVRAKRIATALEAGGHSVWWDRDINAGSRFGNEIADALQKAELVLVLWSRHAIHSAWVQDEATAGRDSGKLVPVLIDAVDPPLGFRQYHAVDLRGRISGRSLRLLLDAVASRSEGRADSSPASLSRPGVGRLGRLLTAIALVLAVGGLATWFLSTAMRKDVTTTIAVIPASSVEGGRSLELARSLAVDLGRYKAGPLGSLVILSSGDATASKAAYRAEISVVGTGADTRADLRLVSGKGPGALWSSTVQNRTGRMVDLREQAAARLGDVLACMVEINSGGQKPRQQILGLYLNGCAIDTADESELSIFRQITQKAPEFAPGWANLSLVESWIASASPREERATMLNAARAHLERAKKLDPNLTEVFAAEANIHLSDQSAPETALGVLDRGLSLHPDSGLLRSARSQALQKLGRMDDAVEDAKKAVELNPLSPSARELYIFALNYAGRTNLAFQELRKAETTWPGAESVSFIRYHLNLRSGDPGDGLKTLQDRTSDDPAERPAERAWKLFLEARIDRKPASEDRALNAFRDRYRRDRGELGGYLQALGTFDRPDEAFTVLAAEHTIAILKESTDILFRPHMRAIRADPRFIGLSDRLGLLSYWRRSGAWPDFCKEADLPYDCQKAGAELVG